DPQPSQTAAQRRDDQGFDRRGPQVKRFVLDASIALAWFLDRPTAQYADHVRQLLLRGDRAVVPALWQLEMANGFIVAERRGALTPSDTTEALENLDVVIVQAVEDSRDL